MTCYSTELCCAECQVNWWPPNCSAIESALFKGDLFECVFDWPTEVESILLRFLQLVDGGSSRLRLSRPWWTTCIKLSEVNQPETTSWWRNVCNSSQKSFHGGRINVFLKLWASQAQRLIQLNDEPFDVPMKNGDGAVRLTNTSANNCNAINRLVDYTLPIGTGPLWGTSHRLKQTNKIENRKSKKQKKKEKKKNPTPRTIQVFTEKRIKRSPKINK